MRSLQCFFEEYKVPQYCEYGKKEQSYSKILVSAKVVKFRKYDSDRESTPIDICRSCYEELVKKLYENTSQGKI